MRQLDVCICTHSPNRRTLAIVADAIARQTIDTGLFEVTVVDNATEPRLSLDDPAFLSLRQRGVAMRLIYEPKLGVANARVTALKQSTAAAVVFVDDDNELGPDFLKRAHQVLQLHPDVGCFSGRIELPRTLEPPQWVRPLLYTMAIRKAGDEQVIDWFHGDWMPWVPSATASMVLRRKVADKFLATHARRRDFAEFGRKGRNGLMSGEDCLIAMSASEAGLKCGYFPGMIMYHHVDSRRFRMRYILRFMYFMGVTEHKREMYLGLGPKPFSPVELKWRLLCLDQRENTRARLCFMVYQYTYVPRRALEVLRAGFPLLRSEP